MKDRILFDSFITFYYPSATEIDSLYRTLQSNTEFSRYYYQHGEGGDNQEPSLYTIELHFPRLLSPRKGYAQLIALCKEYGYTHEANQLKELSDAFVMCKVKAQLNRSEQGIALHCDSEQTAAILVEEIDRARRYRAETGLSGLVTILPRQHVKNTIDTIPEQTAFGRRWCSYDSLDDLNAHIREMNYRLFREGTSIPAIVKLIAALYRLENHLEKEETGRIEEEEEE